MREHQGHISVSEPSIDNAPWLLQLAEDSCEACHGLDVREEADVDDRRTMSGESKAWQTQEPWSTRGRGHSQSTGHSRATFRGKETCQSADDEQRRLSGTSYPKASSSDASASGYCEKSKSKASDILVRDWQSAKLGHVKCIVRNALQELTVVAATGRVPTDPHGRKVAAVTFIAEGDLAVCLAVSATSPGENPSVFRLCKSSSSAKRLVWRDECSSAADIWDAHLLDAGRDAATWFRNENFPLLADQVDQSFCSLGKELTDSKLKVGLCMATRDRLWQLKRALPVNLLQNWPHRHWCHLHVVDCASTDGTLQWLKETCRAAVDAGFLHIYSASSDDFPYWHASVGKNCAHAVAEQDILVNVDNDNLVGLDFAKDVADKFIEGFTVLHYENGEGTCGRIACRREDFSRIRGYDEDAYPMGAQDIDLLQRLKMLDGARFKKVKIDAFSRTIPNTLEDKVKACDPRFQMKWSKMDGFNRDIFKHRRASGEIVRNLHKVHVGIGVPVQRVSSTEFRN